MLLAFVDLLSNPPTGVDGMTRMTYRAAQKGRDRPGRTATEWDESTGQRSSRNRGARFSFRARVASSKLSVRIRR